MDGLKVLEIIKKINPWFKNNQVPQAHLEPFKRREFSTLEKDLGQLDLTTLIIGARRVGKSVLMYQLIDALLKKVKGGSILFGDAVNLYRDIILKNLKGAEILDKDYWYPKAHNLIELSLEKIKAKSFNNAFNVKPVYLYPKECQIKK